MFKPIAALCFFVVSSVAALAAGQLPTGVRPTAYDITVRPDAAKMRFTGQQVIDVVVAKPTRSVTLNAAELVVSDVVLDGKVPAKVTLDAAAQTATFTFAKPVSAGAHKLAMRFAGKINTSAAGLFALDYTNTDGSKDRMLATQFEAPDARRFAPMWDEPGFKTPFTLSAYAPKGQMAYSNMPATAQTPQPDGSVLWRFQPTPKMSSYLLFLGMGNVERKTTMAGNVEIGIISRKGVVDQGDYALASAKRILAAYNDYFGVRYPLPKMDMIAAPGSSQFFGAMENWGAILYFERIILIDPKLQTEGQRQDIFNVVAHEMAHQWFGDLVTMAWWDDLWLNEGFASWMASKISGDLNPSWNATSQSLAFDRQGALSRDARATTHPIIQKITTVDAINDAFDDITYRKGEAVIRMLEGAVGPDVFRTGVRSYMAKYQYANTQTDQLWAEISAAAGKPVAPVMHSFTLQGGVPLVRAAAPVCKDGKTSIALSQGRFALDAGSKTAQAWLVPVRLGQLGSTVVTDAVVSGAVPTAVVVPGCGLTIVNAGQSSYFRTLYTAEHQEALRQNFGSLALDDQIGFVGDTLALANGSYQPIERYLALVDSVKPDASPLVWAMLATQLAGIDQVLVDAPEQAAFRARARAVLAPAFARVGWTAKPDDTPADAQLREDIIPVLGRFGDAGVVADAARYAALSFATPDAVTGAIRQPAQSVFAYTADAARWDDLRARAKAETSPAAKLVQYRALASVKDPALAQKALDLALTDEAAVPIRASMIASVARNHPARAFDWAVAHASAVNALVEANTVPGYIVGLAGTSGDPAVAERVRSYAARALPPQSRKTAEIVEAGIAYRAGLRAAQAKALGAWTGGK